MTADRYMDLGILGTPLLAVMDGVTGIPKGMQNENGMSLMPQVMTFAQMNALTNVTNGTMVTASDVNFTQFVFTDGRWTVPSGAAQLMNAGIPFVLTPGNSIMGNNGALALSEALPEALPGAFFYFPAGAIFAAGAISTLGTVVGGNTYATGTYTGVPLTGGSGTGAVATIVVNGGGAVASVTITQAGVGYVAADSLSANASFDGVGSGSGFHVPVATVTAGSSSVAGWYFGTMSSTSAATIYNNPYPNPQSNVTGDPDESVPYSAGGKGPNAIAFVTTGPGAFTQSTSAVQAQNFTAIPAKLIEPFGGIKYTLLSERPNTSSTSGASITAEMHTSGSPQTIFQVTLNAAKVTNVYADRSLLNLGGYTQQVNPPLGQAGAALSTGGTPNVYTTIDFTVAQNFAIYLQAPQGEYYICNGVQLSAIFS